MHSTYVKLNVIFFCICSIFYFFYILNLNILKQHKTLYKEDNNEHPSSKLY